MAVKCLAAGVQAGGQRAARSSTSCGARPITNAATVAAARTAATGQARTTDAGHLAAADGLRRYRDDPVPR
ncbi:hypothetical protein, partial [Salinispora arenicola]|uniref:hypothetical protein n=1 Tax=Salinispora arenicola TaxID=168697 RepID=UPI002079A9D1